MTHSKLCTIFPSDTTYQKDILLLSYCSCWLILFWTTVRLWTLSGVVLHIASVGTHASPLGWTTLPCQATHTHTHTHHPQGGERMERQWLTSCGNVCGLGWPVEESRGRMAAERERTIWQEGSRQADWLTGGMTGTQAVWSAQRQRGWKPCFKRSRVQIHCVF